MEIRKLLITLLLLFSFQLFSAAQVIPNYNTPEELQGKYMTDFSRLSPLPSVNGITTPPTSPVRTIGEWEELQGLHITWATGGTSTTNMLRNIVRAAKQECRVYILCSNASTVINSLATATPSIDTVNVTCVVAPFNTIWCRDYGMWSVYTNDVDSLLSIDWIYNRFNRQNDDASPAVMAAEIGTPLYSTTAAPWDLVNTGGNFMTDGFGTAFASKLILDDNSTAAGFGVNHTSAEIDTIMLHFMGINRYIKMNKLPYDQIHHIDMHIKLIDEETLVAGQYPSGIADGPQIEANLLYILNNFTSVFGTPYKVIRVPMPDDNGSYPNSGGTYYTYTNASFINKTLIVPTYGLPDDTVALNIYRNALPGYKIVGINSTATIGQLGALHCITKEFGTADPLLISHQKLPDTYDQVNPYTVNALMKHRSGIATATLYYTTDTTQSYISVPMSSLASQADWFTAQIPAQVAGTEIFYYVEAIANSGKQQVRPLPAPQGYWHFHVLAPAAIAEVTVTKPEMQPAFPNPSKGITCIPAVFGNSTQVRITFEDLNGKTIAKIFEGKSKKGEQKFFINTSEIAAGVYMIRMQGNDGNAIQKLLVR